MNKNITIWGLICLAALGILVSALVIRWQSGQNDLIISDETSSSERLDWTP